MTHKSLTELMLIEHKRISQMLKEFNLAVNLGDSKTILKTFNELKWNLEKHFVLEEKAIFQMLDSLPNADSEVTLQLMEEHTEMRQIVEEIRTHLNAKNYSKIQDLTSAIKEHSEFEHQTFYPTLDKKLSEDQKKEIIKRVSEILRG